MLAGRAALHARQVRVRAAGRHRLQRWPVDQVVIVGGTGDSGQGERAAGDVELGTTAHQHHVPASRQQDAGLLGIVVPDEVLVMGPDFDRPGAIVIEPELTPLA
ncbi:hypothetical protein D9M68_555260 [compost metagenome]